ncbi:hypothetical protein CI109_107009 [Kwoniella shandongensis]|uniref:Uncharacterized protein n=1 Tax=Kwoniella shandongensis TaxID=1734106 RepID=A0A5M6C783_9TREE|nr:uncharacterized protein CI109_000738 [Kwoniella shandongensis]KAA5530560.1 hypothetical protein CI109_000738 [Kwoniella shandongensis]
MQPRNIPTTPKAGGDGSNRMLEDTDMASPPTQTLRSSPTAPVPFAQRLSLSPVRFLTTTNAFGLPASPSSSSSSSGQRESQSFFGPGASGMPLALPMPVDNAPPTAGTVTTRRVRRPSMLSLAQTPSYISEGSPGEGEITPMPNGKVDPEVNMTLVQDPSSSRTINDLAAHQQQQHTGFGTSQASGMTPIQPTPRWPSSHDSFRNALIRRTSSAPIIPFEDLKTSTPPIHEVDKMEDEDGEESRSTSPMDMEGELDESRSPLRWMPSHLQRLSDGGSAGARRKGKARMDDSSSSPPPPSPATTSLHAPPFTGRPLPSALLATLISENAPLEHEMQSEARLQRLLLSHPQKLPFTPRVPRGSRGRFPDQVGGDDDDEDAHFGIRPGAVPAGRRTSSWAARNWMDRARMGMDDSDSDSDDDIGPVEPVNSAFAAGMDMDRPASSSSSSMWVSNNPSESGKSTPGAQQGTDSGGSVPPQGSGNGGNGQAQAASATTPFSANAGFPTPPSSNAQWPGSGLRSSRPSFGSAAAGMVPSPGSGFGLPTAFGTLGMGGVGTPLGSPTIEKLELAVSPGASAMSMSSPGLMQYRESQGGSASVRPGKRKAQVEDRFDPYKRPRGSSPSFSFPISPSRTTSSIPIPQSPSHAPLYSSALASSQLRPTHARPSHPYARPISSRSRAASPALSIGSVGGSGGNGNLSTSLGSNPGGGAAMARGLSGLGSAIQVQGQGQGPPPRELGGLGLLSIQNRVREEDEDDREHDGGEMRREDSNESRMEED